MNFIQKYFVQHYLEPALYPEGYDVDNTIVPTDRLQALDANEIERMATGDKGRRVSKNSTDENMFSSVTNRDIPHDFRKFLEPFFYQGSMFSALVDAVNSRLIEGENAISLSSHATPPDYDIHRFLYINKAGTEAVWEMKLDLYKAKRSTDDETIGDKTGNKAQSTVTARFHFSKGKDAQWKFDNHTVVVQHHTDVFRPYLPKKSILACLAKIIADLFSSSKKTEDIYASCRPKRWF